MNEPGILILNKDSGLTSFSAVRVVRRTLSAEKAGHTGTLDPMATGVLPVLLGRATKLASLLPTHEKAYEATAQLGVLTDTGDAEGRPLAESGVRPTEEELRAALASFLGDSSQLPPMYSAVKQQGKPLYLLARQGQVVERAPRPIHISDIALTAYDGERFSFSVRCSAGTYVRTLAEDAAAKCGALCHLTALCRTEACGFTLADAVTLQQLTAAAAAGGAERFLRSAEEPFLALSELTLSPQLWRLFQNGVPLEAARCGVNAPPETRFRIRQNGAFAALARLDDAHLLRPLFLNLPFSDLPH